MDFSSLRFLVVGDVMLDRYLYGKVRRISPEAPVPILELETEENRLGGAANVALNLRALGAQVALVGVVGEDEPGGLLRAEASKQQIDTSGLVTAPDRPTTLKIRLIAQKHHLLRVDRETTEPPPPPAQEALSHKFRLLLDTPLHGIILEDYDKGTLTPSFIQLILQEAARRSIPTFVDPKKAHFWCYAGATLFKPNLRELSEALGTDLLQASLAELEEAIQQLRARMPHRYSVVTLGDRGIIAFSEEEGLIYKPAHYRNIVDVSGAGDTVISVLAATIAKGGSLAQAVALANLAGGLVCEYVGVVPLPQAEWFRQAQELGLL
ncbi:MAG: PfkB family carbohydrate kinase [Bacteroidia bacterium]|nr:PfkB family carbohydrate kinase [Bacteroidia bacterium]MDW8088443.1 PfkB family carbohydrate kinase [Bacteroidia bacterium]